jgi:hypothetical protein
MLHHSKHPKLQSRIISLLLLVSLEPHHLQTYCSLLLARRKILVPRFRKSSIPRSCVKTPYLPRTAINRFLRAQSPRSSRLRLSHQRRFSANRHLLTFNLRRVLFSGHTVQSRDSPALDRATRSHLLAVQSRGYRVPSRGSPAQTRRSFRRDLSVRSRGSLALVRLLRNRISPLIPLLQKLLCMTVRRECQTQSWSHLCWLPAQQSLKTSLPSNQRTRRSTNWTILSFNLQA